MIGMDQNSLLPGSPAKHERKLREARRVYEILRWHATDHQFRTSFRRHGNCTIVLPKLRVEARKEVAREIWTAG